MTRMQRISRAPVLSATRSLDSCWITVLPRKSLCDLDDLGQAPVLRLRDRARLDDLDDVADLGRVLLVVRLEALRAADDLLVARVGLDRVDLDHDRLVALVRNDGAEPLLAAAELALGLRQADDRLAFRRLLALDATLLRARTERARQALALRLRAGLRGGGGGLGGGLGGRLLGGSLLCRGGLLGDRLLGGSLVGDGLLDDRLLDG